MELSTAETKWVSVLKEWRQSLKGLVQEVFDGMKQRNRP